MDLHIFDTLQNQKIPFKPIHSNKVRIYVCGITVYGPPHLGHGRTFVVFDVIVRYLRSIGYDVTFVRNHTDVDDKIIKRAQELNQPATFVAEQNIEILEQNMKALNVLPPDVAPKVTEHIPQIISLIETLVAKNHAYPVDGNVFFELSKYPEYGKLSKRNVEDMQAGSRIQIDESKRHPLDFALWKKSKPGEPFWESPWGPGRPGWHIECSAMSMEYLGNTLDIHGGGSDLIFPHHENEIAQSQAAMDCTYSNCWMHSGMINIQSDCGIDEKMSKSLGNFWTINDALEYFVPETIRYFYLTTHYRKSVTFCNQSLQEASRKVEYLYCTLQTIEDLLQQPAAQKVPDRGDLAERKHIDRFKEAWHEAMCDDFHTPRAIAALLQLMKIANDLTAPKRRKKPESVRALRQIQQEIREISGGIGLLEKKPEDVLDEIQKKRIITHNIDVTLVENLIEERIEARKTKNFCQADKVREKLCTMHISVMDTPQGTIWKVI